MGLIRKLFSPTPVPAAASKEITAKHVKELFRAIRNGDLKAVKAFVTPNPRFANVCAVAPPKKDDGQSPLQVSLKTGQFAIAEYLIDSGADVNFMEESKINEWRTPALHDAIRAALFSSEVGRFDLAIRVVRKMLERKADPNAVDSYGNNCLMRAILDARIRIPKSVEATASPRLLADIGEVFKALIQAGADVHATHPERPSAVEETCGTIFERFVA